MSEIGKEMRMALSNVKQNSEIIEEVVRETTKLLVQRFDHLIELGMTREEALRIVIERGTD